LSQKDPLNTGKIPTLQFQSILSFIDSKLIPAVIQEIARPFQVDNRDVNYFLFLEAIDQFVPPPPTRPAPPIEDVAKLTQIQDPNYLLQQAKETIESRRIDIDLHFSCLAREGLGDEVTRARFARVILGMKLSLNPDEIEAIASLFTGDSNKVRYKDFMEAVRSGSTREVSAVDVVSRLKSFLSTSFVSLAQSASRFDREHSGIISAPQFSSALQFLKFPFSSQELAAIREAYPGTSRGTINWKVLCAEVDPSAEPAPSPDPLPESTNRPRPPNAIAELVSKVFSGANFIGLDLETEFRHADLRQISTISQETFVQILKQLPIELSVSETRALVSFYRVSGSNNVNYVNFLLDSKSAPVIPEPIPLTTPPPFQTASLTSGVHDILKRYKAFCVQKRINPSDIFTPYDIPSTGPLTLSAPKSRMSGGFVPINRLHAAFHNVQFELRRGEPEALQAAFADSKHPDLFNYAAFLRALKVEDIASPEIRASLKSMPLSHDVEETARLAAGQIREKLLARHRKIVQAFAGVTEETIPPEEFQRRLFAMDLVVRSNQMQALLRKFRANLTGQVDWKAFVANVDQSKTIGE
jgi:Ca2+-binding EF-hand superfamily protein